MFTSNFARIKTLPSHLRPVSIAIGPPRWYVGETCLDLAPTRPMLRMSYPKYIQQFENILAKLDPQAIFDKLGDNAVLLCWESPGVFCHRRAVAQWLELHLQISVPEFGYDRDVIPTYPHMPEKDSPEAKVVALRLAQSLKAS